MTELWLRRKALEHPAAAAFLARWQQVVKAARWTNLEDLRRQYPATDPVRVKSNRTVHVFNVAGNKFPMITAIHFNRGLVFTLRLLTHSEYSKDRWKDEP